MELVPPEIRLENTELVFESGGDGFMQKGETVTLKFSVRNTSQVPALFVAGTFINPQASSLPRTIFFGDIQPNELKSAELTFDIPNSMQGIEFDLESQFIFNNTFTYDTIATIPITLLPCIEKIFLDSTSHNLFLIDADFSGADIYANFYINNLDIGHTPTKFNLLNSNLPLVLTYSPCENYFLSEMLTIEFKDYDTLSADDLIGTISLSFGDYAAQQNYPTTIYLNNSDIWIKIILNWN